MKTSPAPTPAIGFGKGAGRADRADRTIAAAVDHLLDQRREDGHWRFELEGGPVLQTWYSLLLRFLGRDDDPRIGACSERLRRMQEATGGWAAFPGGPVNASDSVMAYLCLKLAGDDARAPHMVAARDAIRSAGGPSACNSYTKQFLRIFGLMDRRRLPAVPPELILLPRWFWFDIYEMSSWTRAIVVPLSVVWALQPRVPLGVDLDELTSGLSRPRAPRARRGASAFLWGKAFEGVNVLLHLLERIGPVGRWRRRALREAESWMKSRMEGADGLSGNVAGIVFAAMALRCLGYEEEHPLLRSQLRALEELELEDDGAMRLQPCFSPVWDTALTLEALLRAGVDPRDAAIREGAAWLLDREIRTPGDWRLRSRVDDPGAWCFEYRNDPYPDCDDTAAVLHVLSAVRFGTGEMEERRRLASERGTNWLLGMQNPDGGWAAFDRRCGKEALTFIPFADHNAMIDPSTPDVTARVVAALTAVGLARSAPAVRRGVEYLLRSQESDGSWTGRWGANHIYGTWLALSALAPLASRSDRLPVACGRGGHWLLRFQNEDGGWGESLLSYEDPGERGRGASTAAQTAWAMLGLIAAAEGEPAPEALRASKAALDRAFAFLARCQRDDGAWRDEEWTGVGFPRVFYLRYHGYARYFPLEAVAAWRRFAATGEPGRGPAVPRPR